MDKTLPTVSQVVRQIKNSIEKDFSVVTVIGEVSNFSSSGSGHYYFTLSDPMASLSCCLFRMDAQRNSFVKQLRDGDKVHVMGPISVYEKRGTFQLVVKRITPVGVGDLKTQLEKLKKRLASEGLFDLASKKPIPLFPKRIGLITAENSAAYHDFIKVLERRSYHFDILYVPALVQGQAAPASLRRSLEKLIAHSFQNPEKACDVIVLCRGGGSLEDLWSFNDEGLAWDIFNCPIPVISAVGHEVDFSISDYVADKRCETPTAAAEVLSAAQVELHHRMMATKVSMKRFAQNSLYQYRHRLHEVAPWQMIQKLEKKVFQFKQRIERSRLISRFHELLGLHDQYLRLEEVLKGLNGFKQWVENLGHNLENRYDLLKVLGPQSILNRGYTYIRTKDRLIVSDKEKWNEVPSQKTLEVHFRDGVAELIKP